MCWLRFEFSQDWTAFGPLVLKRPAERIQFCSSIPIALQTYVLTAAYT